MKTKDRLILLADKFDRKGMNRYASLIDNVLYKRSFDEETRQDVDNIIPMINSLLDELDAAIDSGIPRDDLPPGTSSLGNLGALQDPEVREFYKDRVARIRAATGYIYDLNELTTDEDEAPQEATEAPDGMEGAPAEEGEPDSAEPEKQWWKFWKSDDNSPADRPAAPEEGPAEELEIGDTGDTPTAPEPLDEPGELEELDEDFEDESPEDGGSETNTTRMPGVNVQQTMSNVGNVTIE